MILIVPIGKIEDSVPEYLVKQLSNCFQQTIEIGLPLPLPIESWDQRRSQYQADVILDYLPSMNLEDRELGIADVDLYALGLNFVFGEADVQERKGVISLARLKPEFYGLPRNDILFQNRALKEAIHELGHTYGLKHCPNPKCVMHFSNALEDTDIKKARFCSLCQSRMQAKVLNTR